MEKTYEKQNKRHRYSCLDGDSRVFIKERSYCSWSEWKTGSITKNFITSNSARNSFITDRIGAILVSVSIGLWIWSVAERAAWDVFYDFDSTVLSAEAQNQLKQNAAWLENNSANKALIEGHCDSRGTSEYNMALGERRASAAKEYLVRLGIASSRLETVSFGEERPFDTGKGEDAWAKNRRAHFVMKK